MFFHSLFLFPMALFFIFLLFLMNNSCMFIQPSSFFFIYDEVSFFMIFMSVFIFLVSYFFSLSFKGQLFKLLSFLSMFMFCLFVFASKNLFLIYFSYECSLLPIIFIILKWGSYPERSLSCFMLFLYTSVFTVPFLFALLSFFLETNTFTVPFYTFKSPSFGYLSFLVFFTFSVKLPIYGLHFWLPMAHVEAPSFGSMLLAGVLLKLGGVGLLRFSYFMDFALLKSYLLAYLFIFLVYSTLVCLYQSDFKRLVAYSSVSHMMTIPILFLSNNILSTQSLILVMFIHGLSSSLLFMLVGIVYSFYSTRQLILIRGLVLVCPLTSLFSVLIFFLTLGVPPFPSFIAEVFFFTSSFYLSPFMLFIFIPFVFLSLVYNVLWFSSLNFFNVSNSCNFTFSLSYISFLSLLLSLFFSLFFMLIFFIL